MGAGRYLSRADRPANHLHASLSTSSTASRSPTEQGQQVVRPPASPRVAPAAVLVLRRQLLSEGDHLLETVEQLLLADQVEVPGTLAEQVARYAERLGWRRVARDLLHAHDVILSVQEEILRVLPVGL